jgi:hypothetical protein
MYWLKHIDPAENLQRYVLKNTMIASGATWPLKGRPVRDKRFFPARGIRQWQDR